MVSKSAYTFGPGFFAFGRGAYSGERNFNLEEPGTGFPINVFT
jgi:hypothetical protein